MTGLLDERALARLRRVQVGVVARRQLLEIGADDEDIARMQRRRALATVHPGVYVDHTGRLSDEQARWAAVLACWPAALSHVSALPAEARAAVAGPSRDTAVHVAVDRGRHLRRLPGVVVHRVTDLDERVAWHRSPPRVRVEHAIVDVTSALLARDRVADAFAVLASTCHSRETTPARIADALATRTRVAGRPMLSAMLSDIENGVCSVLEHGFVDRVERPHGLPPSTRQRVRRPDGAVTYTDVDYQPYGLLAELDGLAFHDGPRQRDRDAARDLANLAESGEATVRLTYGLVFGTPCRTAAHLARLLRRLGWPGEIVTCASCRAVA